MFNNKFLLLGLMILSLSTTSYSETIKLHLPIVEESPLQHLFYHELLTTAIQEAGHTPELIVKRSPQKRIQKQIENGDLSIYWMVNSAERDEKYIPIKIGLTDKLIGKRILLIKQGEQAIYDQVKTLEDFQKLHLIAGMGENWFDAKVWEKNNLPYQEKKGNWQSIYKMIPRARTYNYFARGVNEIIQEYQQHADLEIEKGLVFIYDRDVQFYLSKVGRNAGIYYQTLLTEALQEAKDSGLIERLTQKYWGENLKALNYEQRTKIYLQI